MSDDLSDNKLNMPISFMAFWQFMACELGSSRLRINNSAKSIREFIHTGSDHKNYLRDVIQQSYKRSHCHHLKAPINIDIVLDILGETAYDLQGKSCDDLLDIELLEEIAWHIGERFSQHIELPSKAQKSKTADVVSLPGAKIRRANSRL